MSLYKHIKVDDALKEHSELIKKLRINCKEDIAKDEEQYDDDVFLVKFCLSHKGDEKKATEAVKAAIKWRTDNKETLVKLATGWKHPSEVKLQRTAPAAIHGQLSDGSPLFIVDGGRANVDLTMELCSEKEVHEAMIFGKEFLWQKCIEETKKRGYFVKMVVIQNMKYGSIFDFNRAFMKAMGAASTEMELVYAQLVGTVVLLNPLSIVKAMLAFMSLLAPASLMSKIRQCSASSTVTGDINTCPIAKVMFHDLETTPSVLGGQCGKGGTPCKLNGTAGCMGLLKNDRKEKITEEELKEKK